MKSQKIDNYTLEKKMVPYSTNSSSKKVYCVRILYTPKTPIVIIVPKSCMNKGICTTSITGGSNPSLSADGLKRAILWAFLTIIALYSLHILYTLIFILYTHL